MIYRKIYKKIEASATKMN